jgi:hypothetical protein
MIERAFWRWLEPSRIESFAGPYTIYSKSTPPRDSWPFEIQCILLPAHALILEAFAAVRSSSEGARIDFLAVKNHLLTSGKLEEAGGVELLDEIWDFVPTPANWRSYAEGVVEHYQRRVGGCDTAGRFAAIPEER